MTAGDRYFSAPFSSQAVTTWLQRAERGGRRSLRSATGREREVLQLVAEGYSSAAIAGRLSSSQVDLIRYALARGILPPHAHGSWEKALRRPSRN